MNMPVSRIVKLAVAEGYVVHNDGDFYDTKQGHVDMYSACISEHTVRTA